MTAFARLLGAGLVLLALSLAPAARAEAPRQDADQPGQTPPALNPAMNDYPTAARAEYVFACMTSNGRTQEALRQCACAIDVIAAAVPYSEYEKAETILRMRSGGGYLAQEFRIPASNTILRQLEEAQAEADFTCF